MRRLLAGVLAACALAVLAVGPAQAAKQSVTTMNGFAAPGTPAELNKVIVLKQGDPKADHVLVLVPGTSAGAGYLRAPGESDRRRHARLAGLVGRAA